MSLSVRNYVVPPTGLHIQAGGNFLFLMSEQSPVTITVLRSHSAIGRAENITSGFRYGPAAARFDELVIESKDGNQQTIQLAISDDPVDYTALTGTVNVIDQSTGRAVALRNEAFMGYAEAAASATLPSYVQLWNPADSGVNVILNRISKYNSGAGGSISEYILNAELAGQIVATTSKNVGGAAAAKAQFYEGNQVALSGASVIYKISPGGDAARDYLGREIVINPGFGYAIANGVANDYVRATFEWQEQAI